MTQHAETMRRIQVGLVGLGAVLLILLVGSAILSRLRSDPGKAIFTLPAKTGEKPKEPLAKLGIAPADVQENIAEGVKDAKAR